ncbi:hypothetical protein LCGC14_2119760 [marine sediment metagenome]|uniref:Uncharacterized protein n=1 Tax=marine sediment metagenome TaxID=412755 RepID=A0A0F9ERQ4_9ZZZZ
MASLREVFESLEQTLEQEGFKDQVFTFDFEALSSAPQSLIVIPNYGGLEADPIDTYGDNYLRSWVIEINLYTSIATLGAREAGFNMIEAMNKILTALEVRPHLGQKSGSNIRPIKILRGLRAEPIEQEAGTFNWLKTVLFILVPQEESAEALE